MKSRESHGPWWLSNSPITTDCYFDTDLAERRGEEERRRGDEAEEAKKEEKYTS